MICFTVTAQSATYEDTKLFVRVFDFQGKKISKGKILSITNEELQLNRNGKIETISLESIGSLMTKRSLGHNTLIGLVSGLGLGAIFGIAAYAGGSGWYGFAVETFIYGPALGLIGALVGIISVILKKSNSYIINGDADRMNAFKHGRLKAE